MTVLVGSSPMHRTADAVRIGAMLARSLRSELLVVAVVPAPWRLPAAAIDKDYRDFLGARANESVTELLDALPPDVRATSRVVESTSISEGLVEVAGEVGASMLLLGSSTSGPLGRIALGSITERLLHSSPVPVVVPPRGFVAPEGARLRRVNVAYAVGPDESSLVLDAARLATRLGARLRLVSFAVSPPAPPTSRVGLHAEREVVDTWAQEVSQSVQRLRSQAGDLARAPEQDEPVIGRGASWPRALSDVTWEDGDILVVGSSRSALSAKVFLGGTASKITRGSPVPVLVLPRSAGRR